MKSFAAKTTIRATAQTVWAILTDAPSYPSWNPTVDAVDGAIALGAKITVRPKLSGGRAFPVKVSVLDAPKRMVWTGGMPLGLFKGERTFTLTETGGAVEVSMREEFTGPLAPLIGRSIPDLQPAFDEFVAALKTRAERG